MNKIIYEPLAAKVLVVAVITEHGDWAAYINAVNGVDHDYEYEEVARTGSKLSKELAHAIFLDMDITKYRK